MDREKYMVALEKKAARGDLGAMVELAETLGHDSARAGELLDAAAARGSAEAHVTLGWAFEKGYYGKPVDVSRAVEWYGRAIELGETELGPMNLVAHVKKLGAKAKRVGKVARGATDPLDVAIAAADLGKRRDAIVAAALPSIRLVEGKARDADLARGASKIGGRPDLPAKLAWPEHAGKPLAFVAQINCAAAAKLDARLPKKGLLSIFYDVANQPDRGTVVFTADPARTTRRAPPPKLKTLATASLTPTADRTLPWLRAREARALKLAGAQSRKYHELLDAIAGKAPLHRMLGHADMIQGDMREDDDQLLLLQLDSYWSGNLLWGDNGRLYFWISAAALAKRDVGEVQVLLQSH